MNCDYINNLIKKKIDDFHCLFIEDSGTSYIKKHLLKGQGHLIAPCSFRRADLFGKCTSNICGERLFVAYKVYCGNLR